MHRRIIMCGLVTVATTAGLLTGLSQPVYASGGTIKVAYQQYGANITLPTLMKTAAAEFAKQYPGWTVSLNPIVAPENPYYTKLDLESSSASTAPDGTMVKESITSLSAALNASIGSFLLAPFDLANGLREFGGGMHDEILAVQ